MTIVLNMTTFYTCMIIAAFVMICQGEDEYTLPLLACMGPLIAAPIVYMVGHVPPDMHTPVGEWAVALVNLLGPVVIGVIAAARFLTRRWRRVTGG